MASRSSSGSLAAILVAVAVAVTACASAQTAPDAASASQQATIGPTRMPSATPATWTPAPAGLESPMPSGSAQLGNRTQCHSSKYGITVTYPAEWYAYEADAGLACTLFDPKPFPTITDSSDAEALITIFSMPDAMAKVVSDYSAATTKVLSNTPTTVGGHAATVLEIDESGYGFAPNGLHGYLIFVDVAPQTLVLSTEGIFDPSVATADWPYEGYAANKLVLALIAQSLRFD